MPKKNYNSNSLYFTDRKAYYAQKETGAKSDNSDIDQSQYEKMVGFAGGQWGTDSDFNRALGTSIGVNAAILSRYPNLASRGEIYNCNGGYISIQDAVWLCQKAWEEFQLFRNTIEAMVEFSMSKIKLSSKNKAAKVFCETWMKAVNITAFAEQFYREMYRSCNIPIYSIMGTIKQKDAKDLRTLYAADGKKIPVKYTILNPAQIALQGGITSDSTIHKILSPYEAKRLLKPKTEAEKIIYNNLDAKIKKALSENYSAMYLPLENVNMLYYQKQDYEYFATPLFYGVLDDIELKLEMKKADKKILSTVENIILKITMGGMKGKDGQELAPTPEHMAHMRTLFQSKKTQRVLVADHTTKAEYVIPDLTKVVGREKYEQVNEDIREGLQSIFGSNEKFSNQMTKVKVFCERLKKGQQDFVQWLEGELSNVCKTMGFSNTPTVKLSTINLEDPTQVHRLYNRLCEIGVLTPVSTVEAIENGWLPNEEENLESQRNHKKYKEEDLFGPQTTYNPAEDEVDSNQVKKPNGRPNGSTGPLNGPRAQRVVGNVESISMVKVQDVFSEYGKLEKDVANEIKSLYKVETLTEGHIDLANTLSKKIVANYPIEDWKTATQKVVKEKEIFNNEKMEAEIQEISEDFEVDEFLASVIYHTQK